MVSRDTLATALCVLAALPAAYAAEALTGSFAVAFAALLVVGVGVPTLYREVTPPRT